MRAILYGVVVWLVCLTLMCVFLPPPVGGGMLRQGPVFVDWHQGAASVFGRDFVGCVTCARCGVMLFAQCALLVPCFAPSSALLSHMWGHVMLIFNTTGCMLCATAACWGMGLR